MCWKDKRCHARLLTSGETGNEGDNEINEAHIIEACLTYRPEDYDEYGTVWEGRRVLSNLCLDYSTKNKWFHFDIGLSGPYTPGSHSAAGFRNRKARQFWAALAVSPMLGTWRATFLRFIVSEMLYIYTYVYTMCIMYT